MVDAVSPQLLQSISTPSIDPSNIFKSYLAGREMKQQQEEFSIRKDLAELEKAKFAMDVEDRDRSIKNDVEDRQMQRELFARQEKLANLDISIKQHEVMGGTAVGVLELMQQSDNEQTFAENYQYLRESTDPSVRDALPKQFKNMNQARVWAMQASATADKLIPYLSLQRQGEGEKEWQHYSMLASLSEEERTPAQQRDLDMYLSKGNTTINIPAPSKARLVDTASILSGIKLGDKPLLSQLDKESQRVLISAASSKADVMVANFAKTKNPIDRAAAIQQITQSMIEQGQFVPNDTLKGRVRSKLGLSGGYVYKPVLSGMEAEQESAAPEQTTSGKRIEIHGGYMFDMDTLRNLGKAP